VNYLRLSTVAVIAMTLVGAAAAQPGPDAFTSLLRQDENPPKSKKNQPDEPEAGKEAPNGKGENGNKKDKNGDEGKNDEKEKNGDKDKKDEKAGDLWPDWLGAHAQGTIVSQGNWKFRSPYQGTNSLLPILNYRTTETATIYLDAKCWEGADVVFNPEVSGGEGLSHTLGMAGFPNGEATRIGAIAPTPYVARLFFRQVIGLGGGQEDVEDAPNQLAGKRDIDRITVRIGKVSATDIFDDNAYSHDPRTQFLNWSLMDNGAWDYPANTRGYTYGITFEYNQKDWAWRYGVFGEPTVANGSDIDPLFLKANGNVTEFEYRYDTDGHPGKVRLLAYANNAHMGSYREALTLAALTGTTPDITLTRAYRTKYGFGLNLEQELDDDLGAFARLGWNDGQSESWAFTEIDRTAAFGLLWKGTSWNRPEDHFGIAAVVNGLSDAHRDYLAAGGLGFIIGDGALRYGFEEIIEAFYSLNIRKGIVISFDVQGVNHPAYNRDRGPVGIAGVRAHFEY
jgi:high affinity Mn2+ porin